MLLLMSTSSLTLPLYFPNSLIPTSWGRPGENCGQENGISGVHLDPGTQGSSALCPKVVHSECTVNI